MKHPVFSFMTIDLPAERAVDCFIEKEYIMAENQEKKNEEIKEFGKIQMKNKI